MRSLMLVVMMMLSMVVMPLSAPDAEGSQSLDADPTRIEAVIEYVDVVSEAPLVLYVEGYYPADCDVPSNYEIEQWGNEVRLSIYQVALSDSACDEGYTPYHETLPRYLFADLTPGSYFLNVNGYALRAHVSDRSPVPEKTPTPVYPPEPRWVERDLCVGDLFEIEPRSPTEIYHSINVSLQDETRQQGEIVLNFMRGRVRVRRETSRLLAYRADDRFGLTFEALRPGDVSGSMSVLTESISPYGYRYMLLVEYLLHINDCHFPPPPTPEPWMRSYATIESVDVLVLESYPMQLHLHVTGTYAEGCVGELIIDQWRERNRVVVEMYQLTNPQIMCPAILRTFDMIIPLEGGFESGWYVIHVNDFVVEMDL